MPELRAHVANCLVNGDSLTRSATDNRVVRDTIEIVCDGKLIHIRQKSEIVHSSSFNEFKGKFLETTTIYIFSVSESEIDNALKIVYRLCWLLSFACLSRVVCYGYDYSDTKSVRNSVFGTTEFFRPTLDIMNGEIIKKYLEQTYPIFKKLERSRKLNVVFDYLIQASRSGQPTEARLIYTFIALESLKSTYAKSTNIPFINGFFRKGSEKRSPAYKFEELLYKMLKEMKMRRGLKRIISLRNSIFHSGLSQTSHRTNFAMYEKINTLISEYVLRLLKYRGEYLTYAKAETKRIHIK